MGELIKWYNQEKEQCFIVEDAIEGEYFVTKYKRVANAKAVELLKRWAANEPEDNQALALAGILEEFITDGFVDDIVYMHEGLSI